MKHTCSLAYVSGYRAGQPCSYAANTIILLEVGAPFLVCGYHARAYTEDVQYRLDLPVSERRRRFLAAVDAGIAEEIA